MTFHSDIDKASTAIERASAINAKHEAARQEMIAGFNQAIALIISALVVSLSFALVGAPEMNRIDRHNQEVNRYVSAK